MVSKTEFINSNTLLVVSKVGQIKQLHTPIRAVCINSVGEILRGSTIFIDAVGKHSEYRICYQICQLWYPYDCFKLS